MPTYASVGQAVSIDGREAGDKAAAQALGRLAGGQVRFAWVFASHAFNIEEVVRGVRNRIDEAPLWGLSTIAELSSRGESEKSVVVGLVSGRQFNPYGNWWNNFGKESDSIARLLERTFSLSNRKSGPLFIAADGTSGNSERFIASLNLINVSSMIGCLAAGDIQNGVTHQIGGRFFGAGGLSAAIFDPSVRIGLGVDHGWIPIGQRVKITQSEDFRIQLIDHRKPSDVYSHLFGELSEAWTLPPLNRLARLYPLNIIDQPDEQTQGVIRSPLRIEADGSLRMNAEVPETSWAYFMVGSVNSNLEAVKRAAKRALGMLDGNPPALGLIFADNAYRILFEGASKGLAAAVQEVLGMETPILGGYNFGQIVKNPQSNQAELLNQHLLIAVIGNS
jgi:hypothetical protein